MLFEKSTSVTKAISVEKLTSVAKSFSVEKSATISNKFFSQALQKNCFAKGKRFICKLWQASLCPIKFRVENFTVRFSKIGKLEWLIFPGGGFGQLSL